VVRAHWQLFRDLFAFSGLLLLRVVLLHDHVLQRRCFLL
jgi:hypothetical protein